MAVLETDAAHELRNQVAESQRPIRHCQRGTGRSHQAADKNETPSRDYARYRIAMQRCRRLPLGHHINICEPGWMAVWSLRALLTINLRSTYTQILRCVIHSCAELTVESRRAHHSRAADEIEHLHSALRVSFRRLAARAILTTTRNAVHGGGLHQDGDRSRDTGSGVRASGADPRRADSA